MPDISMCDGVSCPIKKKCYRHNATPSEYWQSWFANTPYDHFRKECDHYWKDEKIKFNKNLK